MIGMEQTKSRALGCDGRAVTPNARAKGKKIADILMSRLKPQPTKRRLPGPQRPTRRDTSKSAQAESLCHEKAGAASSDLTKEGV